MVLTLEVTNFAIHDIALVDSPAFHLTLDTCNQGEVYNMIIRGGNEGGLDGIDLWGFDLWVHDVEVTNKDECVTVKSPANHILVENIYCNWSGGCAMGSLGLNTGKSIYHIEGFFSSRPSTGEVTKGGKKAYVDDSRYLKGDLQQHLHRELKPNVHVQVRTFPQSPIETPRRLDLTLFT